MGTDSGDFNSGDRNSGNRNSGNFNSGNRNSGNFNSGDFNSGDFNSGDFNSGDFNSGNFNSGNFNSGNFNSGNFNSGFFCTGTPAPMFFDSQTSLSWDEAWAAIPAIDLPVGCEFVLSSNMTEEEKNTYPNHGVIGGYLKILEKDFRVAFAQAWRTTVSDEDKKRFLSLPNFCAEKFLAITGVDVRE